MELRGDIVVRISFGASAMDAVWDEVEFSLDVSELTIFFSRGNKFFPRDCHKNLYEMILIDYL